MSRSTVPKILKNQTNGLARTDPRNTSRIATRASAAVNRSPNAAGYANCGGKPWEGRAPSQEHRSKVSGGIQKQYRNKNLLGPNARKQRQQIQPHRDIENRGVRDKVQRQNTIEDNVRSHYAGE